MAKSAVRVLVSVLTFMYLKADNEIVLEFGLFAEAFMNNLFPILKGFYELEHDTAIMKANQTEGEFIIEYVMVVLGLMTLKKFSDFFQSGLSPQHQQALDSNIYEEDKQRLQEYVKVVENEVMDALEEDFFGMGLQQDHQPETRPGNPRQATQSDLIFEKFHSELAGGGSSIGRVTRPTHGRNGARQPRSDDRRREHVGVPLQPTQCDLSGNEIPDFQRPRGRGERQQDEHHLANLL